MKDWFTTSPGRELITTERAYAERLLSSTYGRHGIQLNTRQTVDYLQYAPLLFPHYLDVADGKNILNTVRCSNYSILPFANESVDLIVLPHVLEQHAVQRLSIIQECNRILNCNAQLLILGFNPWSFFSIWRMLDTEKYQGLCPDLLSAKNLSQLLRNNGFIIKEIETFFYRPLWANQQRLVCWQCFESWGQRYWPAFGAAYGILAEKSAYGVTPLRMRWQKLRDVKISNVMEPTTRGS